MGLFRICAYQLVHSLPSVDTSRDNIRISRDNLFNFCFQKKKVPQMHSRSQFSSIYCMQSPEGDFSELCAHSILDGLLFAFTTYLYYLSLLYDVTTADTLAVS